MNPYAVVRKTLQWIGYVALILFVLAFLALIVVLFVSSVQKNGWGMTLAVPAIFIAMLVAVGFICYGFERLGIWWKKREYDYRVKLRKKKWDAGNPDLDPEPLDWYGYRSAYRITDPEYSTVSFRPREYYEQDEEKYIAALPATEEEEE